MDVIKNFDVLVVYSEKLANSANSLSEDASVPFTKGSVNESYNLVYAYFLKTCKKNNLKAALTTSADIVGAGLVRSYWLFENETWIKIEKIGFSKIIFDKFSPNSKKAKLSRNLLFSSNRVRAFNNPYLFYLCFDKQKTYNTLHKFSIPTVTIDDRSKKGVDSALKRLKGIIAKHQHVDDFSKEIIMKDRFGAGGINIYKYEAGQSNKIIATTKRHKTISFIIQPFVNFNKGFRYKNSFVSTDIRVIYLGKTIVQTYIRIANNGDFRCNEHSGGLLKYVPKNKVPSKVVALSRNIAKFLNTQSSMFALDFIISNHGNTYLLEANTGPGLDWNLSIKENEIESKKLMRIIIKEIVRRTKLSKSTSEGKGVEATVNNPMISERPVSANMLTTV